MLVRHYILLTFFRYLATGCSYAELHFNYRVGKSTVGNVIRQVCAAIFNHLKSICMPPITKEKWEEVSKEFKKNTNFPNCIGAIDCKHVRIQQPSDTGSLFFNYKHFFSIVLLAVCDAKYSFLFVDVGSYGKSNDSSIFQDSLFYRKLTENTLDIPDSKPISNLDATPLPHVFVADDAFGLSKHIMCPYSGKILPHSKRILNYRLSRARRYIECTFGIMANKWRIFHRPLNVNLDLANSIILACCMLHNYVRERDGYKYEDLLYEPPLVDFRVENVPRPNMYAREVRDRFARYFIEEGKLPWQDKMV